MKAAPDLNTRLLIHQNTQLSSRLQNYRRTNQELSRKNEQLNTYVQSLTDVLAAISSAWRVITDSEEMLYALISKRTDAASKGMIGKYKAHFRTFGEIADCLGQKLTNEGHSESAARDAKTRLSAFFNNYLLFFKQLAEAYFRHNDDYASFLAEKQQSSVQMNIKQIMSRELEHRQKIKEMEPVLSQVKENLAGYQSEVQHKLLNGIVAEKEDEIERLKVTGERQARRLAHLTDYSPQNVQYVADNEGDFECHCGGVQLKYCSAAWAEALKAKETSNQSEMVEEREEIEAKVKQYRQLEVEKELLMQRNTQLQSKIEKVKLQNRLTEDQILQSPVYSHLKMQFSDLVAYTNELLTRLSKQNEYLNELERIHYEQMEELSRKQGSSNHATQSVSQEYKAPPIDNSLMNRFKGDILKELNEVKEVYTNMIAQGRDREDKLKGSRELLEQLQKDNQDLHRKLKEVHERTIKSVDALDYRHKHFNEVEKAVNEMMGTRPAGEGTDRLRKTWSEYVDYVKTRDKKIRGMEEMIRKKDKEIAQKARIEEVLKSALAETEAVYVETKQKLDGFTQSVERVQKEISNFSEESYKGKIEVEQEKNFLAMRLKNEVEVKTQLEERIAALERVESEVLSGRRKEAELEQRVREFQEGEREKMGRMALELREGEQARKQLEELVEEKERAIGRLSEDKERKNLEMNKMRVRVKAIEEKNEYEVLRMELDTYKAKVMCRCGADRERDMALKTCPHIFCRKCIDDTTSHRNRKCPMCGIRFTKSDIIEIAWA